MLQPPQQTAHGGGQFIGQFREIRLPLADQHTQEHIETSPSHRLPTSQRSLVRAGSREPHIPHRNGFTSSAISRFLPTPSLNPSKQPRTKAMRELYRAHRERDEAR